MANPFLGREPTDAQVKLLDEAWPKLEPGTLIKYEEVERVIREGKDSPRFRSVTDRWRRNHMRKGVVVGTVAGLGFTVLSDKEKLDDSADRFRSGRRKIAKAVVVVDAVRVENLAGEQDKARALHQSRLLHATADALAKTQKEIALSLRPVQALPMVASNGDK